MKDPLKYHIMKSPLDLDEFGESQIDLTRQIDTDGDKARGILHINAMQSLCAMLPIINAVPWDQWQRACYEAHKIAARNQDDLAVTQSARLMWAMIQFMQEQHLAWIAGCRDPVNRQRAIDKFGDDAREMFERFDEQEQG